MHVVVVVLGDVGRSPRMQYHALSLLQEGYDVSLVGYEGEDLIPDLASYDTTDDHQQQFHVVRFQTSASPAVSAFLRKVFPPLYFAWRLVTLLAALVWALWMRVSWRSVNCVLVQNPPAIPLLFVSYVYCQWLGLVSSAASKPRLVIDWHNLGYSMLRPGSMIRKLARKYEEFMAPLADGHLCVTKAMKEFLVQDMKVNSQQISVLYDCPPAMFQPLSVEEQHVFLQRLQQEQESLRKECKWIQELSSTSETLFTEEMSNGTIVPRLNRPVLVTSSTSWTEDEDFGILLDALVSLDERLRITASSSFRMLVLVTGKGPMKEYYQECISKLTLQHVAIHTLWLTPGDYPRLLACADVGISLHTSTSGLDLPMKVLDLFGCETPVCAVQFDCLDELVQDKVNGRVFQTSDELASQFDHLFSTLTTDGKTNESKRRRVAPHSYGDLATYSANLKGLPRWSENWKEHALPILSDTT
jgi:beta-1,4-mannosyltransferase